MKIKAAVLWDSGKPQPYANSRPLSIEEIELDPPKRGEVLIQIKAAGLHARPLDSLIELP